MKMHILRHVTAMVMLELLDEGLRRKTLNTELRWGEKKLDFSN